VSDWNGTWTGAWNGGSTTFVTISGGRVVRHIYLGAPQPIRTWRVSGDAVSFGSSGYLITMKKIGPGKAAAEYKGLIGQGDAVAIFTKN
jgi:hypothetical protein